MPLEKVRKVLKIAKEPVSLETPVGDERTAVWRFHRGQKCFTTFGYSNSIKFE